MSTDAILARLTALAAEIEQHSTGIWLLERERDELRGQLRRALNADSTAGLSAVTTPGAVSEP